jgi:LCP family protein required for cell wall assembly
MPNRGDARGQPPAWDLPTDPGGPGALPPLPRTWTPPRGPVPYGEAGAPPGTSPLPTAVPPVRVRPATSPPSRGRQIARVAVLTGLALALLTTLLGGLALHRAYDFGRAISPEAPFSTQTGFMSGVGRVNVVVLGYGGAGHDGAYLTDSIMVASLVPGDGATTLISVPRDLWVQVPPGSGQYAKINTAYTDGLTNGFNGLPAGRLAGGAEAAAKVSEVLGITVSYWVTIDFSGFRKLVDALGGVNITVPTAFTARYPINDDPQINAGWKIIHFNTGPQHMNGEQAIEYARARYVLTPVSEGTDFARSVRQQLLVRAILSRARSISAWPGLAAATDALQGAIYTNLSITDLALFAEKLDLSHAAHIGLSNQNVLVDSQSSDGQDILLPQNGDWTVVQQYVASHLKS